MWRSIGEPAKNVKYDAINTITTRAGRADFYSSPITEVLCSMVVDEATHDQLAALNVLNARFALPTQAMSMIGLALSGVADDISVAFTATLPDLTLIARAEGYLLIRCKFRIDNSTFVP